MELRIFCGDELTLHFRVYSHLGVLWSRYDFSIVSVIPFRLSEARRFTYGHVIMLYFEHAMQHAVQCCRRKFASCRISKYTLN